MLNDENENNRRPKSLADLLEASKPSVSVKYLPHLGEQSQPEGTDGVEVAPADTSSNRDMSSDQDPRSVSTAEPKSLQNSDSDEVVKSSSPDPQAVPSLTRKILRPGSSQADDNPGSTTQW